MSQLAAGGHKTGAALRWHSRQGGSDSVLLFFSPPMAASWWKYEKAQVVRLDTVTSTSGSAMRFRHKVCAGVAHRLARDSTQKRPFDAGKATVTIRRHIADPERYPVQMAALAEVLAAIIRRGISA
jgi:hypothetical protein